jgi:DNA polymerase III, alpha subunit
VCFLDSLIKYGQLFQQEKAQMQHSLFGGDDAIEIAQPPIPKADRWPSVEKLNNERELIGIYLSAHPLDDYSVIMNNMCNTHIEEIGRGADLEKLSERDEITFGGIITSVNERFSQKTGKPFGIVTIQDFKNSGELTLFGDDWMRWNGLMKENYTIFITAKCQPRYRNSNLFELKIQNVEQLYDVKKHRLEKFTIMMDTSTVDDRTVSELVSLVERNEGDTQLYFELHTADQASVTLHYRNKGVDVDRSLLDFIANEENMEYKIN